MSTKEAIFELLRTMPDDVTWAQFAVEAERRFAPQDESEEALGPDGWEAAWMEEGNRRLEEMRSGKVVGIPGDVVMKRLKEQFG